MKTKDVIETLKTFDKDTNYEDADFYNEVIDLLKRGEKFEKIVNELEKIATGKDIYANWLRSDIRNLKKKYFPKEDK